MRGPTTDRFRICHHRQIGNPRSRGHSLEGSRAWTEGTRVPARSLVMGRPGKVKRALTDEEVANILWYAGAYVNYRLDYL